MKPLSYKKCELCAKGCGVDRTSFPGACRMTCEAVVSRAALHHWEEPPISGSNGSGTIFFSGCSLSCIFCQNVEISRGKTGKSVDSKRLAEIMLELEKNKAHNVNLVTPTHFVPTIIDAIRLAKNQGLKIPIVYNTGGYDTVDTIRALDGLIDVYLPDLKYFLPKTALEYSGVENYPEVARAAISEMVRQTGSPVFNEEGIMTRGTIVRLLLLPGHVAEAKLSLKYLIDTYGDSIYVSLMNQYTPMQGMKPPLDRCVTHEEYRQLTDYAEKLGIEKGFTQEFGTAKESFIPPFDLTGV